MNSANWGNLNFCNKNYFMLDSGLKEFNPDRVLKLMIILRFKWLWYIVF